MIITKIVGRKKLDAKILALVKDKEIITLSVVKRILELLENEYKDYPDISKDTIKYLRKKKKWQPEADSYFREYIRRWAAIRSFKKKKN